MGIEEAKSVRREWEIGGIGKRRDEEDKNGGYGLALGVKLERVLSEEVEAKVKLMVASFTLGGGKGGVRVYGKWKSSWPGLGLVKK